jgi:hypothetical protein
MFYYKETLEDSSVRYCETTLKRNSPNFEEISQEEYITILNEIYTKAQEQSALEQQYQEEAEKTYIEQLEEENASLLYKLMTGEELTDV